MRMIDADTLKEDLRLNFGSVHDAVIACQIVDRQPTLTQQNEPLTWDEMCAMGEKPIYIVELEKPQKRYWALAYQVSKYGIMLASTIDLNDYGSRELYGKSWLAYRRPPEGEEDT